MGETVSMKSGSGQGRRLEALQARFDALEAGARERLVKALGAGQHKLGELDGALERMTHEDWTVDGLRKRIEVLRSRAEEVRSSALKRVADMPASAVTAFAKGSRAQVKTLSREIERLVKLIEPPARAAAVDVLPQAPPPGTDKPARVAKQKVEA
jgi:hypothetical protein